jgi:DNA-binding NtrC family response regulator
MEDIPLLAQFFVTKLGAKCGRTMLGISDEALLVLERHDWPGNVRELQNVIERAVVLGSGQLIQPADLPSEMQRTEGQSFVPSSFHEAVRQQKKEIILNAVIRAGGKMTEAARSLKLQPTYLHRLVSNLDLRQEINNRLKGN